MSTLDVLPKFLAIIPLAYFLFAFISVEKNPFVSPGRFHIRRKRWQLARAVSMSFLFSAWALLAIDMVVPLSNPIKLLSFAILFLVFSTPAILRSLLSSKRKKIRPTKTDSDSSPIEESQTDHSDLPQETYSTKASDVPLEKAVSRRSSSVSVPHLLQAIESPDTHAPASEVTHQVTHSPEILPENQLEPPEVTVSEEFELELELATAHFDQNMSDFDQSIAEAEFYSAEQSGADSGDTPQPNIDSKIEMEAGKFDHDDGFSPDSDFLTLNDKIEEDTFDEPDHSSDSSELDDFSAEKNDFADKIAEQKIRIRELEQKNQSLGMVRDLLTDDIYQLQQNLKESKTVARKSQVEAKQALELKQRALSLAATERKKRKLTEIRAKKVIVKLQRTIQAARLESS